MKMKKILAVLLSISMASVCLTGSVFAASSSDLNKIKGQITEKQAELDEGKAKQNELLSQIDEVNKKMETVEAEISGLENQLAEKQAQIEAKQAEMDETQVRINEQNDQLGERLRVMYKNGETGIIEVVLGSTDIVQMISNLNMVQHIYNYDIDVLEDIQKEYEVLEEQKSELQGLKSDLEQTKNEKERYEDELDADRSELEALEAKVAQDNEALEAQIDKLNNEANALTAELQAGALKASNSKTSQYSGGVFLWPCPNYVRISSYFGYRMHPILHYYKYHSGMDIASPSGSPILAAANGTVIFSGTRGGYGKCIMIDHGGGLVTLYGHCSALLVGAGTTVTRGQQIAKVGSTGQSTGPHLHFEARKDGTAVDPQNYL